MVGCLEYIASAPLCTLEHTLYIAAGVGGAVILIVLSSIVYGICIDSRHGYRARVMKHSAIERGATGQTRKVGQGASGVRDYEHLTSAAAQCPEYCKLQGHGQGHSIYVDYPAYNYI